MASPFPEMDPYIEDPEIWRDFHGDLAAEIRAQLNATIQPRYVARMTPSVTYELIEVAKSRTIRPDVAIWQPQPPISSGGAGVAVAPLHAPVTSRVALEVPLRLYSVEIVTSDELILVTAIEILSPVNKRTAHEAYLAYLRKRRELLRSEAHLLGIDLLQGGERPPLEQPVPSAPYYVTLSRANDRPVVEVWPIRLADPLPLIPVPLLGPDPDAILDLSAVITSVYERGAYARLIDYQQAPPPPALSAQEKAWLNSHLQAAGIRP